MAYKITYTNNATESVDAVGYRDTERWIDFNEGGVTVLRVLADKVRRVEWVQNPTS